MMCVHKQGGIPHHQNRVRNCNLTTPLTLSANPIVSAWLECVLHRSELPQPAMKDKVREFKALKFSVWLGIAGAVLICASVFGPVGGDTGHLVWWELCREFGITALLAGGIAIFFELNMKSEFLALIQQRTGMSLSVVESGIVAALKTSEKVEFDKFLQESHGLSVVFAYGTTWLSFHDEEVSQFLNRGGTLIVYLPDPSSTVLLSELAVRFNKSNGDSAESGAQLIAQEILEAQRAFIDLHQNGIGTLQIYHMPVTPTYTIYLFDQRLVFNSYRHRPTFAHSPYLVFERGWVFDFYTTDLDRLRDRSKQVYPQPAALPAPSSPE